jgi:hypothetical protein
MSLCRGLDGGERRSPRTWCAGAFLEEAVCPVIVACQIRLVGSAFVGAVVTSAATWIVLVVVVWVVPVAAIRVALVFSFFRGWALVARAILCSTVVTAALAGVIFIVVVGVVPMAAVRVTLVAGVGFFGGSCWCWRRVGWRRRWRW